jgi:hypothetical protein
MLTIKLVSPDGAESLREAYHVRQDVYGKVFLGGQPGSGETEVVGSGTLYVMNADGQTISRYILGKRRSDAFRYPPPPHAGGGHERGG